MGYPAASHEQAQYWNGDEATHWLDHEDRYDAMLAPFTDHLLSAAGISVADRVVDVGCGCGSSTRAAGRLAVAGEALGVDLSRQLLCRAEQRAREEGLANVSFEQADAEVHPFANSAFDALISRFGVMFFADPVAAFANLTRALRPGGRLAVVCWAGALDNEWIAVPGSAAAQHVAPPELGDSGTPGPFSLADRRRLYGIMDAAGLVDIAIDAVRVPLLVGSDLIDTMEFLNATGMGRALLGGVGAETVGLVTEAVESALEPYLTPEGGRLGSKAWLASARRA